MISIKRLRFAKYGWLRWDGDSPQWKEVKSTSENPYSSICQVRAYAGNLVRDGSGWLAESGVVVTAAHVILGADSLEVIFPTLNKQPKVTTVVPYTSSTEGAISSRSGSDEDLAYIAFEERPSLPGLSISKGRVTSTIHAVGFHNKTMVESEGKARSFGTLLGHDAHTKDEHSGCPLLDSLGKVLAVHLGTYEMSWQYMTPEMRGKPAAYLNAGVVIDSERAVFITPHIG